MDKIARLSSVLTFTTTLLVCVNNVSLHTKRNDGSHKILGTSKYI